jgi:hypothetical protein
LSTIETIVAVDFYITGFAVVQVVLK